ncbi:SRPBCC family protein [Roseobacter sp. CCS2]|uniref:SRPBCC family protein n=1 Tax=Roseobacter sp. CCS2 TaxID=391593 RepID=UPI0000F3C449|nr:SRPBCC family protein [Roseobacter sp. CCS2]EBA11873.1 hypothetical protein RCCS2_18131 [Roseobacter sp. CCS2]
MKHCQVSQSLLINVPPANVWGIINAVEGMEDWYPGLIQSSKTTYSEGGVARVCTMANGGTLNERILLRDTATRTFVYAIDQHPLPAKNVVGTLRVDDFDGHAHVTWSAQFTTEDADHNAMSEMVNAMYRNGLSSLSAFAQT